MSTTFQDPNDPTGSIAICYSIFGDAEEARWISAKVPPLLLKREDYTHPREDDDPDIYIA
jgi:hypothetical protein